MASVLKIKLLVPRRCVQATPCNIARELYILMLVPSPALSFPSGKFTVRDLIQSLREYAYVDPLVAYHLWVLMFPIVWATLEKSQQLTLAKPIITLLYKEYHMRQANARPNIVQVG